MSSRGITLRRQAGERVFIPNRGEGIRLRITAEDAVDMPAAIFLHQIRLVDPDEAVTGPEFLAVCSVFDLTIYPASTPDLYQFPQFYRSNVVDIIIPTLTLAEETWVAIYYEVTNLVESLNKLEYMTPGEEVRCGEPLAEDNESASAESTSEESVSEETSASEESASESESV